MGQKAGSMTYDDVEDILGPVSPKPKNKGGRPVGSKVSRVHPPVKPPVARSSLAATYAAAAAKDGPTPAQPASEVMGGVTVFWLAKAFGMEVSTVRKRIADCPPLARKTSGFIYSLSVAAQYLVKPKIDVKSYLEAMKPSDLPQQLQPSYWEANLKRQKFELTMGQMWVTEDVLEVFAEVFKTIKFSIQLWPDTLERQSGFSDEDREILITLADDLQDEIYQSIDKLAKERSTPNALQRFYQMLEEDDDVEDIL
jgi:hypothetical protein